MNQKPSTESVSIPATQIKVIEFTTQKSIPVWLVESQDIPVVSVSVCFKNAGSKSDPLGKIGTTDFLSRMLSEGCGNLNASAFKKYLLENNIDLIITQSIDDFIFEFRVPKTNVKAAFQILKSILISPGFASDSMEKVRQQMIIGLNQSLHSEIQVAVDLMKQQAFPNHPYGQAITEKLRDLPAINAKDLKNYMKENFTVNQMIVAVCGAINQPLLTTLIDDIADLKITAKTTSVASIDPITAGTVFVKDMKIPQSAVIFFQPGLNRQDPDFYAAIIMMKILGDGAFDSRLWNEVREKQGLAYSVNSSMLWNRHTAYIMGVTATQNNSVQKVMQIIRQQWELLKKDGITAEELKLTKEKMIGAYPLSFGSTYQTIGMLRMQQLDGMEPNFVNHRNNMIEKVTLEDVNRVAKKLLDPKKLTFIVVGKPEGEVK